MSIENFFSQLQLTLSLIKANIPIALIIIAILWGIFIINFILGNRLNFLGIYPRHLFGLFGIFFYTFLHADFNHLFFNSFPLFVLTCFILLKGFTEYLYITATIILISGFAIWLFGRRAIHIGASSLILGYWSYLLINAYYHPSVMTIPVAIICIYYFGGLALNLFPSEEKVSWEGHVFGFLSGIIAYYLFP